MKMKTVKESTDKPNCKPLPGDKSFGIEPDILFYKIEYANKTEE